MLLRHLCPDCGAILEPNWRNSKSKHKFHRCRSCGKWVLSSTLKGKAVDVIATTFQKAEK